MVRGRKAPSGAPPQIRVNLKTRDAQAVDLFRWLRRKWFAEKRFLEDTDAAAFSYLVTHVGSVARAADNGGLALDDVHREYFARVGELLRILQQVPDASDRNVLYWMVEYLYTLLAQDRNVEAMIQRARSG